MANWTPQGFVGKFFRLGASYSPPPPGVPPPSEWGNESIVRERFGNKISGLTLKRKILKEHLPMSPSDVTELFITYFGPAKTIYGIIEDDKRAKFKSEFEALWGKNNISTDGTTTVEAEYLEVIATK
jgi:hypothetical protein